MTDIQNIENMEMSNDSRRESIWIRVARKLLTAAGVSVFIYFIYRMGWRNILDNITRFGGWFAVILLVQMVWVVMQACSWYIIQNSLFRRAPLRFFVRIKIISDKMNTILPTANLGGDAMRILLIKPRIPLKEGVAGIMLDKTVESVAGVLFMACGILIAVLFFPIPRALMIPALICLLVLWIAIGLLIFFQFKGFFRSAMKLFGWIPAVRRLLKKKEETLLILDDNMRRLYSTNRVNIFLAMGLHFVSRLSGALEVLIVMQVLGKPVGFVGGWFISAAVTFANTILFFVPGHWGVQEGMYMLVLKTMYFSGSVGLSLGIIRRIRRMFLMGLGILLFHMDKRMQENERLPQVVSD